MRVEPEHLKNPSISDVLDQPYERTSLEGFNIPTLNAQDSDVGKILGVDGENADEAVHVAVITDLDVEEELLAARNEE